MRTALKSGPISPLAGSAQGHLSALVLDYDLLHSVEIAQHIAPFADHAMDLQSRASRSIGLALICVRRWDRRTDPGHVLVGLQAKFTPDMSIADRVQVTAVPSEFPQ
jgi:hypothetical protein